MTNPRRYGIMIVVAASCILVAGCGSAALSFNNACAKGNQRLAGAGLTFGKNVGMALQTGNANDIKAADDSYQALSKVMESVKKEITDYNITGIEGAKEMKDAYLKFLGGQEAMFTKDFRDVLDTLKNPAMDGRAKQSHIEQIMRRVEQTEKGDLGALQTAQKAFAAKNKITLK